MKKLFTLMFCFVFAAPTFAQNLIINPGAELDPVANGWTIVTQGTNCSGSLNWRILGNQSGYPAAQQGTYLFFSGCNNVSGEIYQDVNVAAYAANIDGSYQSFSFSGYMQVYDQNPSDSSRIIVEYRNSSAVVLDKYDEGYKGNRGAWVQYINAKIAPVGTRTIRIRLFSKNVNGTSVDAYFDNLSLTTAALLPINLLRFSAEVINNKEVKLFWQTASEINNDKFTIERSSNAIDWIKVNDVNSKASNASSVQNYNLVDKAPLQQVSYYRLKQTDLNGNFVYSNVISVKIGAEKAFSIFPNPAKNFINLTGKNIQLREIKIYNLLGQDVTSTTTIEAQTADKFIINVSKLNIGQYFIKTKGASHNFNKL